MLEKSIVPKSKRFTDELMRTAYSNPVANTAEIPHFFFLDICLRHRRPIGSTSITESEMILKMKSVRANADPLMQCPSILLFQILSLGEQEKAWEKMDAM